MDSKLEMKDANIFLSPHEPILKDEGVFGLGKSHFDPATNTVRVVRYSSNPIELMVSDNFLLLALCTTFSHEIGHYCLTMGSRLGIVIKDLNVVLDGMCLTIIRRMVKAHGRVWMPFSKYLELADRDPCIDKLIRNMLRLDELENALLDNYQITQELFAYSWSGFISAASKAIWTGLFGEQSREVLLKDMASFGIIQDSAKMTEINERIREYFARKGISPEDVGEKEAKEALENLDQIFGSDKDIAEGVLRWIESIQGMYANPHGRAYDDMGRLLDTMLEEYRVEVDKVYEKSYTQHIEALKIFRSYSSRQPVDMLKIMGCLLGVSCLFAPIVDPRFIREGRSIRIGSIDKSTRRVVREFLTGRVSFDDLDSIVSLVTTLQNETNSIKMQDMHKVPLSSILGTRQWFSELLANLDLNREERRFVKRLIISNKVIDLNEKPLLACESLVSLIPPSFRSVIRVVFLLKDKLKRWKPIRRWAEPAFEGLEKLHIDSSRTLFSLLEVYRDIPFSSPLVRLMGEDDQKKGGFIKPSFAVYIDRELLTLYTNRDFSSVEGELAVHRHIIGNLKELCLKGAAPQTVCPISYLQGNELFCEQGTGECWLRKVLRMSARSGDMLICCKDGKANFLRTYEKVDSPDLVLRFKIDDRDAQRRREELDFETDMLEKIWKPQVERINRLYKRQPEPKVQYDGEISDLYLYRKRKMEKAARRIGPPILGILWKIFSILFIPFKLDYRIHKAILRHRLKRTKEACRKTQREITDIMRLIHNT